MPTYMNMDISFVLQKGNKKTVKICDNLIHPSLSLSPNDYNTFKQIK